MAAKSQAVSDALETEEVDFKARHLTVIPFQLC